MSADDDLAVDVAAAEKLKCCASCGVEEIDDIKLKPCPKCDLVEYCSDECQEKHRQIHEAACKERAAELYEEILFKQPESTHLGDCPICFLPMPHELENCTSMVCCSQMLCDGCFYTNQLREVEEKINFRCPFCRHHYSSETLEEDVAKLFPWATLDNPVVLSGLGQLNWIQGDHNKAFQRLSKAATLGDIESMYNLAILYRDGEGVEKDKEKERFFLEKAAIAGHLKARFGLGHFEWHCERPDRAVAHWIIAATLGHNESIGALRVCYKHGIVSKQDFAAALRAFQAAVDALKSPHRTAAKKCYARIYGSQEN